MIIRNTDGRQMLRWMEDLWDYPRSITGHGTRSTLEYLKNEDYGKSNCCCFRHRNY